MRILLFTLTILLSLPSLAQKRIIKKNIAPKKITKTVIAAKPVVIAPVTAKKSWLETLPFGTAVLIYNTVTGRDTFFADKLSIEEKEIYNTDGGLVNTYTIKQKYKGQAHQLGATLYIEEEAPFTKGLKLRADGPNGFEESGTPCIFISFNQYKFGERTLWESSDEFYPTDLEVTEVTNGMLRVQGNLNLTIPAKNRLRKYIDAIDIILPYTFKSKL